MAAVLAGGEGAVLAGRAVAALMSFRKTVATWIDVIVTRRREKRPGLVFHEATLHSADRTVNDGIPVTSVPRTLLDLASQLSAREFEVAFWEAERLELIDPRELRAFLARSHGQRGMKNLRRLADLMLPHEVTVRSPLERRLYELIRASDLPLPALNMRLEGFEVDACWVEEKVVVELDGAAYHRGVGARLRDEQRDARLRAAGFQVLRVRSSELGSVLAELQQMLSADARQPTRGPGARVRG
jgi:very-short-patch-repair endonuclease